MTRLQSERQSLYDIYRSLWTKFNWKVSILVLCKILRLFVNTLTADDKYSLVNRDNLMQPIQILLSQKQKNFSTFFSQYLKFTLNLEHFRKKRWLSEPMYFWYYGLPNRLLGRCPRSVLPDDSSTSNIVNGPKHCLIMDDSTFTIFIVHYEGNWVRKSLF